MDSSRFEVVNRAARLGDETRSTAAPGGEQPRPADSPEVLQLRLEVEHLRAVASALMADLSNHWTAVVGTLELGQWRAHESLARDNQQTLKDAVQASAGLLRSGTLAFVRYQRPPTKVRLARLLEALADVLASRLPPGARLAYHLDESLPAVLADDLVLAQLIDELVSNAAESVAPETTIRIVVSKLPSCPPYEPGRYVRCYRFVGPALVVAVSWPASTRPPAPPDSLLTSFFTPERLLAIQGALHLDLSLAIHLDESSPGVRTARLLIPLGSPPTARS